MNSDTIRKVPYLLVVVVALCDIFSLNTHAGAQSSPWQYQSQSNPWYNGQNQRFAPQPGWPISNQSNTTPWPALGQNSNIGWTSNNRQNQNGDAVGQNSNGGGWTNQNHARSNNRPNQNGDAVGQNSNGGAWTNRNYSASNNRQYENREQVEPAAVDVTDNELREFSESLLREDTNNAFRYVTVDYQGKTTSGSKRDEAPELLLSIHPDAFNIPTIKKLLLLHDNYELSTNVNEVVTVEERTEENNLLDAFLETEVMQLTRTFLMEKGVLGRDPRQFKNILKEIWFTMYPRGGRKLGSSGFEHVFLAELKGRKVSGLHNWLYFNGQEIEENANYLGYMRTVEFGNKGAIISYHFTFQNLDKPVDSMFIGTSPELEMALYTTCFLLKPDQLCKLRLGGKKFSIQTWAIRYQGKKLIGSAFPQV